MYNRVVSWRRILALIALAVIVVMMGALVHEIFDIHDRTPFPIDPEFPTMACCYALGLCLSVVVTTVCLLGFYFIFAKLLLCGLLKSTSNFWRHYCVFDIERLLFSPPLVPTSLRI